MKIDYNKLTNIKKPKYNPIRKQILKRELLKGKDAKSSLLKASYSKTTAHQSTSNAIVRICQQEILAEFDKSKITPEYVLQEIERLKILAIEKGDLSNFSRGVEMLGRHLAMFTDKKEIKDVTKDQLWDEFQRYKGNRLKEFVETP